MSLEKDYTIWGPVPLTMKNTEFQEKKQNVFEWVTGSNAETHPCNLLIWDKV